MSESELIPHYPVEPPDISSKTLTEVKKHYVAAALLSSVVPGGGQFLLGQKHKGIILLLLLACLLFCFWPLRVLRFYSGLTTVFCAWIALYLYAVVSAQLAQGMPLIQRPSRWWLIVTLPITLLTLSLLGAAVTRVAGFRSFKVPSTSMEKTIRQGDVIVADFHSRAPQRRDIIVFYRDATYFIKRVVAIPGDSIEAKDGVVRINEQVQVEPYVEHTGKNVVFWLNNFGPITVPDGKYFVMGDNRDISLDSRSPEFGLVDEKSVLGKPLYVLGSDRTGRSIQ